MRQSIKTAGNLLFFHLFQRVLTAEYVDGCKINNVAAIQSMGLSLADVS